MPRYVTLSSLHDDDSCGEQSLFVSEDDGEGDDGSADGSAAAGRPVQPTRKGVYTAENGKRVYATSTNNSKYRTAAAWVQAHMLEEPVCGSCSGAVDAPQRDEGLSLEEMASHIQDMRVPDALAGPTPIVDGSQCWKRR